MKITEYWSALEAAIAEAQRILPIVEGAVGDRYFEPIHEPEYPLFGGLWKIPVDDLLCITFDGAAGRLP